MTASTKTKIKNAAAATQDKAASAFDAVKAQTAKPAVVQAAKVAGVVVGVPVVAGFGYALFATVANKTFAALA